VEALAGVSGTDVVGGCWSGRSVLVTGATGMIGSWLCRRLVDNEARLVALVRDADPASELVRSGTINRVTIVEGTLERYDDVERAVLDSEVDSIFHLGAQTIVGTALRAPLPTLAVNVMGTCHVLEVARRHPDLVQRTVIASSDKAYGAQARLPYTEDTPLQGRHPYEVSKSAADLIAQGYHSTYGVPVAIARCGNVYGGGDLNWSRIVPGSIRALLAKEPLIIRSDGTFLRDYVFVEDVVDAYLALGEALSAGTAAGGAFNFSAGAPLTVLQMYDAVVAAMGVERIEPVIANSARAEIHDQYLDSSRARAELGWEPRFGLEAGLRATVAWYRTLLGAPTPAGA
jgi:CDP-glucose 4,6-dehydratase